MKKEQADRIVEAVRNMFYPKEIFNHEALSGREVISINDLRTALEGVELEGENKMFLTESERQEIKDLRALQSDPTRPFFQHEMDRLTFLVSKEWNEPNSPNPFEREVLPSDDKFEEALEKEAFRVPYDGTNNFYDDITLKHWRRCWSWVKSNIKTETSDDILEYLPKDNKSGYYGYSEIKTSIDRYLKEKGETK